MKVRKEEDKSKKSTNSVQKIDPQGVIKTMCHIFTAHAEKKTGNK